MPVSRSLVNTRKANLPFLAFCLLLIMACNRNTDTFTVIVKNSDLVLPVRLSKADTTGLLAIDSLTKPAKGDFKFMVNAKFPSIYYLQSGDQTAEFIATQGDTVIVDLASEVKVIKEGIANAGYRKFIFERTQIEIKADSLANLFISAQLTDSFPLVRERINNSFNGLIYNYRLIGEDFIRNNPASVGLFSVINARLKQTPVYSYPLTPEVFLYADSAMTKYNPENPYTRWLKIIVENNKQTFGDGLESVTGIKQGEKLPPIQLPGLNDLPISVSPLKGQIAVVYLWDEGNLSRKSTAILRSLNERYKEIGLEIYAIAFSQNKKNWISLITLDKMWWNNMIDQRGFDSPLLSDMKIKRLPYFIVIDNNRAVLAHFSSAIALDEWVSDYFKDDNKKD